MIGAIDGNLLLEIAESEGWVPKPEPTIPSIKIDPEYLTSVPVKTTWNDVTSMSTVDHPSFTAIRKMLDGRGFIRMELGYWNRDQVLRPFMFNGHEFKEGDQFPCASALGIRLVMASKLP